MNDRDFDPDSLGAPFQLAGRWVTLGADFNPGELVARLSIAVGPDEELLGSDVDVSARVGRRSLLVIQRPNPVRPLPVVESRGATAFALFRFSVPPESRVESLAVRIGEHRKTVTLAG